MNATQLAAAVFAVLLVGAGAVTAAPAVSTQGQTASFGVAPDDAAANQSGDASQRGGTPAADERADDDESDADENESDAADERKRPGAAAPGDAGADARADAASNRSLPEQASDTAKTVQSTIANWFESDE